MTDAEWSSFAPDDPAVAPFGPRRRRWVVSIALVTLVAVGLGLVVSWPRRPAAPMKNYVAGVTVTAFSPKSLRGGCEVWIGFVEDEGAARVQLERLTVHEHDDVIVGAEAFVPADPQRNGVELLGCAHGARYPSTPPAMRRIAYRPGVSLPANRWFAVVLDVHLPAGAHMVSGSIDNVTLDYRYEGYVYTVTTAGGRFCTAASSRREPRCSTTPEPSHQ